MGDWDHADEMDKLHYNDDDDAWGNDTCKYCKRPLVPPIGKKKSEVLLIGEFPGKTEIEMGVPMVGAMGSLLERELFYLDIRMRDLRRMNLWQHEKPGKLGPIDQKCFEAGVETVLREAVGKRLILLMGSDTVKFFTGKGVESVTGLASPVIKSAYFHDTVLVASVNPAIVFHSGVGEMRLALKVFSEQLAKLEEQDAG